MEDDWGVVEYSPRLRFRTKSGCWGVSERRRFSPTVDEGVGGSGIFVSPPAPLYRNVRELTSDKKGSVPLSLGFVGWGLYSVRHGFD